MTVEVVNKESRPTPTSEPGLLDLDVMVSFRSVSQTLASRGVSPEYGILKRIGANFNSLRFPWGIELGHNNCTTHIVLDSLRLDGPDRYLGINESDSRKITYTWANFIPGEDVVDWAKGMDPEDARENGRVVKKWNLYFRGIEWEANGLNTLAVQSLPLWSGDNGPILPKEYPWRTVSEVDWNRSKVSDTEMDEFYRNTWQFRVALLGIKA